MDHFLIMLTFAALGAGWFLWVFSMEFLRPVGNRYRRTWKQTPHPAGR